MSSASAHDLRMAPYDFELPSTSIASRPAERRDGARLLSLTPGGFEDQQVQDLPSLLAPGDLLVVNDTRVLAARVKAKRQTGGAVELLLLEGDGERIPALVRPGRKIKPGEVLNIVGRDGVTPIGQTATVGHVLPDGRRMVALSASPAEIMAEAGALPLPPYINRATEALDDERYQTVYATKPGAVAAPTAGLHLSESLLASLKGRGVEVAKVTLHVGIGTFQSLRPEDIERGTLHAERCSVPEATANAVRETRARGGRVVAVGTTVTRTLESWATSNGHVRAASGATDLFVQPGHQFQVVDALLTNFHLPRTSLLMLVCAMGGRDLVMDAYAHAVKAGYRFYSYGDAMFLSGFISERARWDR